jgi:uncharacterized membrane protein YhaH (DUF805 family)
MEKYLKFTGLATRSEYWGVILISWAVAFLAGMLMIGFAAAGQFSAVIGILLALAVVVVTTWAGLATTARRCRDAGINPWFTLTVFIPYVNFVTMIVFGVLDSKPQA